MAQLAEPHFLFFIAPVVIAYVRPMGQMTRDAGEFLPLALRVEILLRLQRMSLAARGTNGVKLICNLVVTRQAQVIDRHSQLGRIGAAVGIVANLAQPRVDRPVEVFPFFELLRLVRMAFGARFRFPLDRKSVV